MKKLFSVIAIMFVLSTGVFAASSKRSSIDSFLNDYEKFVVKVEKAADSGKMSDYLSLSMEAITFSEKCEEFDGSEEWTTDDAMKYLKLTNRYSAAALKLSGNLNSDAEKAIDQSNKAIDDYNDLLKAYGL